LLLTHAERGHAIGTDAAQFSVDIGCVDFELREGDRSHRRILRRPIEAGSGKQLHIAFLDPRRHAVAIELDLVDPVTDRSALWRPASKAAVRSNGEEACLVFEAPWRGTGVMLG
jgi:hypothetical protein